MKAISDVHIDLGAYVLGLLEERDRAAFEAHLKTGHFRVFNDASADMILRKHVTRCDLACSGANVASRMGG